MKSIILWGALALGIPAFANDCPNDIVNLVLEDVASQIKMDFSSPAARRAFFKLWAKSVYGGSTKVEAFKAVLAHDFEDAEASLTPLVTEICLHWNRGADGESQIHLSLETVEAFYACVTHANLAGRMRYVRDIRPLLLTDLLDSTPFRIPNETDRNDEEAEADAFHADPEQEGAYEGEVVYENEEDFENDEDDELPSALPSLPFEIVETGRVKELFVAAFEKEKRYQRIEALDKLGEYLVEKRHRLFEATAENLFELAKLELQDPMILGQIGHILLVAAPPGSPATKKFVRLVNSLTTPRARHLQRILSDEDRYGEFLIQN